MTQFDRAENKEPSGLPHHWNLQHDHNLPVELGVDVTDFPSNGVGIEPNEGDWNEDAIKVYSDMIDS